jgi:hypothetical protein
MHKIGDLLHLISISLAIGLAYIALDRFRYTNRVRAMLTGAIKEIKNADKNLATEDTAVTQLRHKHKDITANGLGARVFFTSSRMFGVGDKTGWDVILICIFFVLEYISLIGGSLFPEETYASLYWTIVGICVLGTIFPIYFINAGGKVIKANETFIDGLFACISETKGYSLSISQLKDKMDNH